jgi:hypothetical protein
MDALLHGPLEPASSAALLQGTLATVGSAPTSTLQHTHALVDAMLAVGAEPTVLAGDAGGRGGAGEGSI